jgi:hypothetical protein
MFVNVAAVADRENSKQPLLSINLIYNAKAPHAVFSQPCQFP